MSPPPNRLSNDLDALSGCAAGLARAFVSLSSDIALVIDAAGVIRNVALSDAAITRRADGWVGCHFVDTVTQDPNLGFLAGLQAGDRHREITRRRDRCAIDRLHHVARLQSGESPLG